MVGGTLGHTSSSRVWSFTGLYVSSTYDIDKERIGLPLNRLLNLQKPQLTHIEVVVNLGHGMLSPVLLKGQLLLALQRFAVVVLINTLLQAKKQELVRKQATNWLAIQPCPFQRSLLSSFCRSVNWVGVTRASVELADSATKNFNKLTGKSSLA